MLEVRSPYPQFYDRAGDPLDAGFVYIGEVDENPETNPLDITWDLEGTQSAAQPVRTLSGYLSRNGTPGRVFTEESDYSITVKDRNHRVVYSTLSANAALLGTLTVVTLNATNIETDSICAELVKVRHEDDTECEDPSILSTVEIDGVKVLCLQPPVDEAGSEILIGADDVTDPGAWLFDSLGRLVIPFGATAISDARHVTSKGYVDGLTAALNALIVALTTRVDDAEDDIEALEGATLIPIAAGRVGSDGSLVTGAYQMTSARDSEGVYTVTLTEALADATKAVVNVTPDSNSSTNEDSFSASAYLVSTTEITVRMRLNGNDASLEDCGFFIQVVELP